MTGRRVPAPGRVLLKPDAAPGGPGWTDEQVHQALAAGLTTVARIMLKRCYPPV